MAIAKVFKIESFGATDGPGVRLVVFLQGCNFRCKYCHNPESWQWDAPEAKVYSVKDILDIYKRNAPYYVNGGITVSGGEPMMQSDFVLKLAQACKRRGIRLAIDTAGANLIGNEDIYAKVAKYADLWIVDIKALEENKHKDITSVSSLNGIHLINMLEQLHKPYWLRYVLVKDLTDSKQDLEKLGKFIAGLKHCANFELLPYHNLATNKYKELGINYVLNKTPVMTSEQNKECFNYLLEVIKSNTKK